MNCDHLLSAATSAGKMLLESGAEIYRVEDTICRICEGFGVDEVSSIVLPTGIFVTVVSQGRSQSKIIRIKSRGLDISKIEQINTLSRKAGQKELTCEEFDQQLQALKKTLPYSYWMNILAGCLAAGGFTYFFGGSLIDSFYGLILGGLIRGLQLNLDKLKVPAFFSISFCSGSAALYALITRQFGFISNMDALIIGTLMLLVPGMAITNAIRDSLSGDLISGLTRGMEAVLIAIAVALGPGLVMSLWRIILGGI